MARNDDLEFDPLLGPGGSSVKQTPSWGNGIVINRILIALLLAALVGAGIYFQSEMTELDLKLQSEEIKIETLQSIIRSHEQVIERFNNSVTNTDVLKHLKDLEDEFQENQSELKIELETVQADISSQLKKTLNELGQTVADAETAINTEVDKVKKDLDAYVRTTQDQFSMENSFMVYQLAGTFTILSCLISMWHMTAHLRRFNQPIVQRKILAILWMSPIYAITSWFSLVFHSAEGYLAIIKDFYEAYIIYQFLSFCIAVLGRGDRNTVIDLLTQHADHLSPPLRLDCLCNRNPWENDRALAAAVLIQCQRMAMQFVFLRPLTTIAMFVLDKIGYYGPTGNPMDYRSPQFYIVGLQNLSVFIAFTGLLKFYHAVEKDLSWCRPFAKFLCIKGVVFLTFWQGLAIAILANSTDTGDKDREEWARSAQNFLICLEMLLFSIAHFYTYPTEEWEEGYRASHEKGRFGDTIALGDFFQDLKLVLKSHSTKKKRTKNGDEEESMVTVPEEEETKDDLSEPASQQDNEKSALHDIEEAVERVLSCADDEAVARLGMSIDRMMHEENDSWEAIPHRCDNTEAGESNVPMGQYSGGAVATEPGESSTATESSNLLQPSASTVLRPSIFTAVDDIARKSGSEDH
jgi:hypothetical protein